ncbi:MAG TPA: glycosyltransferase family 2 protein, partial [Acidobacteriaceae bacterium]|nr:glycosyltransferase family 2 protein [Acidobacteriaceae bacterium]
LAVLESGKILMVVSIIIPVLNEAQTIPLILASLEKALRGVIWEVIFVDDGSTDQTVSILERAAFEDERVKLLRFSRNFGSQAAVTAGLDFAAGDAVVVMDGDLQDPPELLPRMLDLFEQGYDIVSPQRISRAGETRFKRWTAAAFYRVLSRIADQTLTPDVGDFRLFSRRAVLAMRSLREEHRYMRGIVGWLGLKEGMLPFERQARAAGSTKYPLLKMLRFGWTGVSSFSAFPLRVSIAAGSVLSGLGFLYLVRVLYMALWTTTLVPGWASVVALQCIFSGMILLALGAIGDYVARTYEETKNRPLYVVTETCNLTLPSGPLTRAIVLEERNPLLSVGARSFGFSGCETEEVRPFKPFVGLGA